MSRANRRRSIVVLAGWVVTMAATMPAAAQPNVPVPSPSRGQLLYATHCVACHDARLHWRDGRRATHWASLRGWVRHWQGAEQLRWSDEDIDEVARHLNDTIYHFERPAEPRG